MTSHLGLATEIEQPRIRGRHDPIGHHSGVPGHPLRVATFHNGRSLPNLGGLKAILGQGHDPGKRIAFERKMQQASAGKGIIGAPAGIRRAGCARPHAMFHKTETHRRFMSPARLALDAPRHLT